jgi:hypothetical protein
MPLQLLHWRMGEKVVGFIPNEDDGVGGRRRERHVAFVLWGHAFGLQHEHDLGGVSG